MKKTGATLLAVAVALVTASAALAAWQSPSVTVETDEGSPVELSPERPASTSEESQADMGISQFLLCLAAVNDDVPPQVDVATTMVEYPEPGVSDVFKTITVEGKLGDDDVRLILSATTGEVVLFRNLSYYDTPSGGEDAVDQSAAEALMLLDRLYPGESVELRLTRESCESGNREFSFTRYIEGVRTSDFMMVGISPAGQVVFLARNHDVDREKVVDALDEVLTPTDLWERLEDQGLIVQGASVELVYRCDSVALEPDDQGHRVRREGLYYLVSGEADILVDAHTGLVVELLSKD